MVEYISGNVLQEKGIQIISEGLKKHQTYQR